MRNGHRGLLYLSTGLCALAGFRDPVQAGVVTMPTATMHAEEQILTAEEGSAVLWQEFWADWDEYGISPPPTPAKLFGPGSCDRTDPDNHAKTAITSSISPLYSPISRTLAEEGRVLISVEIASDGAVCSVVVKKSSGFSRLDRAALQAVILYRFKPPVGRSGDVVAAYVTLPIVFKLKATPTPSSSP
jgi:TonB family protein